MGRKKKEAKSNPFKEQYKGYSTDQIKESIVHKLKLSKSLKDTMKEDNKAVKESIKQYDDEVEFLITELDMVKQEDAVKALLSNEE